MKNIKKIISLVLTLVLCFSIFTINAYADQTLETKLKNTNWSGKKSSITIVVKQPISGTRNAVSEFPGVDVGHTFIRLEKVTADGVGSYVSYFGFYPKNQINEKDVTFSKSVDGKIWLDFDHSWNIARTYSITPAQADAVSAWVASYTTKYNIETNNCTTFAVNALKKAGILNTGISQHSWTLPQSWLDEIPDFRDWYGYTPGDAGEDLRGLTNVFIN